MNIKSYTRGLLVTTGLILAPCAAQGQELVDGLLNYWNFEDNAEDTASDFVGSSGATDDDGVINGTVTFVAGQALGFGQAANFPGGGGNNITVADPTDGTDDIDRTGADVTISLWAQLTNRDNNWQALIAHGEGADYRIALRNGNNPVRIAYAGGRGDIESSSSIGEGPAGDGLWHHIVAVTDGTDTLLYIDGVLESSGTDAAIGLSDNNTNLLCIGCNPEAGREWNGLIDDMAMWDRPLSATEISIIYNRGIGGGDLSTLLSSDDNDNDGLTDAWEIQFGLDPNDDGLDEMGNPIPGALEGALGDFDGDGLSNIDEFLVFFTSPSNDDSDGDTLTDGVETNTGTWDSLTNTGTSPLSADSDGDGIDDNVEANTYDPVALIGSDPNNVDTDGDTIPDLYEVDNALNPSVDDSLLDADSDTLTNLDEFGLGTDPQVQDTDVDGLDDNVEVDIGTDPLNPDSDSDNLLDGVETNNGLMSFVSATDTGTDPNLQDTDGDGFNDDTEIMFGTDPTNGDSTPVATGLPIFDDFEDNELNLNTWRPIVGTISQNREGDVLGGTILEAEGSLEFGSRGYLVTTSEFDPEVTGGLEIQGEFTFISGDDVFTIVTRSDAVPGTVFGEVDNGIRFTISNRNDELTLGARGDNFTIENVVETGAIGFAANVPYIFTVIDDGAGSLSMVVTQKDDPTITASITAELTSDFSDSNFVVLYNRETGRTSSLQELSIRSASSSDLPTEITEISFDQSTGTSGTFSITWTSSLNMSFALAYSTDLVNWDEIVANNITGLDGTTTQVFPNPEPSESRLFFRVEPPRQ